MDALTDKITVGFKYGSSYNDMSLIPNYPRIDRQKYYVSKSIDNS